MSPNMETIVTAYETSLEQQIAVCQAAVAFQGQNPLRKFSKEETLSTHSKNLALLERSLKSPSVKELILPAAYAPSSARLSDLQKVSVQL